MKLTAIPRITFGLVSLSIGLLLAFDLLLHVFPSEADKTAEVRTRVGNSLAIQAAALVQARDLRAVNRTLTAVQARDPEIESIGLRRVDGTLIAQAGDHAMRWSNTDPSARTANDLVVNILADEQRWGALEIAFRPAYERDFVGWLLSGSTKMLLLFSASATLLFYLYLRRMLQHLDPSDAVPERVRGAFDALNEGVLIIDPKEHILLANRTFQSLAPDASDGQLLGKTVSSLEWLTLRQGDVTGDATPWNTSMRTRQPVQGQAFQVEHAGSALAKVVISCSPLLDEKRGVRGCLITVDNVTALEQSHEELLDVLSDLAMSKEQLELKNIELEELASNDALSGCLNRRAFFAGFERLFRRASLDAGDLTCIMADIDHFKAINDRYGHGVGDEAIRVFADILKSNVRQGDLVGRYGGEEFCIVAGLTMERAMRLAEKLRQLVESEHGIRDGSGGHVALSASFGVSVLRPEVLTAAALVDQADRAMYTAKQTGRNRVVAFGAQQTHEADIVEEVKP